jgi:formate dehydrogenase iron-sulfur subunit
MTSTVEHDRRPYPTGRLGDGIPRAIHFDAGNCIGCRLCVEACKDWNELPRGNQFAINDSTWITMEPPVLDGLAAIWGRNSCMHCEYPSCAAVCPVEAITKYDEGPVVIDQSVCIGCKYCVAACPWGVIATDAVTKKATKCTMCSDRVADNAEPFCVSACPANALHFGTLEEISVLAVGRAQELGGSTYGFTQAGGTHVLHTLTRDPAEHGLPEVAPSRYIRRNIPLLEKFTGLVTLTGGPSGKWRAMVNAFSKPWRLKYRYWHRVV